MRRDYDAILEKTTFSTFRFRCHAGGAAAVVIALLLAGCSAKPEPEVAPTVTVAVAGVEKKPIQLKVNADAVLYPLDQAAIIPKITAPVKKFYVNRGDAVRAGQLLAELENQDLTGTLAENQGGYQVAEASYQAEVQKAQQDIAYAKAQLDAQQKIYESRQSLFREGAVSAKDVDEARVNFTQAQNAYQLALNQPNLKAAEAQLNAAKGRTASAQAQVNYTRIVSPIDGVVTDRPLYAGETPASGSAILTVMNLSQVVARSHVSQQEVARLKVGNPATIAAPGEARPLPGKVSLVSPALDPSSTTVEVWVQAANPGGRLKPGASVRAAMVAQTVPNAIVVPAAAVLTHDDGQSLVIMLDTQNVPHKKMVMLGIRDGGEVQITEGLQGGERVVTTGAFELDKLDDDVLAETKILVQVPNIPEEEEE